MKTPATTRSRGSALLLALIAFLFMAGIGAAVFSLAMAGQRTTMAASTADAAFHVAEAGIDDAINKLKAYQDSPKLTTADFAVIGTSTTDAGGNAVTQITGTVRGGTFVVTIQPPYVGLGDYKITSTGTLSGETRGIVTWIAAEEEEGSFRYGLFGDVYVDAGGTIQTDGYDSTKGTWSSQWTQQVGKTWVANKTGHIGSNGNVDVSGSSMVYGNATPGPNDTVTGGGTVYGSTTPAKQNLSLSDPNFEPAAGVTVEPLTTLPATMNKTGSFSISSMKAANKQTLTVTTDVTIYVSGDFDFTGQSQIIIKKPDGKLTIYQNAPSASFKIAGGSTLNQDADPNAFKYFTNATSGTVTGNADFYGAIYAPKSAIKISGTSGVFGSVISKTIDIQGTPFFHYDESLGATKTGTIKFNVKSVEQFVPSKY